MKELIEKFKDAGQKLILLDYDGTLVGHTSLPGKALPSHRVIDILLKLDARPQTRLVIITGRGYKDIDRLIGHLPLIIVAEHGAMIKENEVWRQLISSDDLWKREILSFLTDLTEKCPGSFIEEKKFSIAWHYRNSEPVSGYDFSRELIRTFLTYKEAYGLKILDGKKVVEIMTDKAGKGKAVLSLLEKDKYDGVLCVGDDRTDEEMFDVLKGNNNYSTIKVGEGDTLAGDRLGGTDDVLILLEQL